jgi:hypothetical protein
VTLFGVDWSQQANLAVILSVVAAGIVGLSRYVIRPMFKFGRRVEKSLAFVEAQMKPNGGSSLRDAVDVLGHRVAGLETNSQALARTATLETHLTLKAAEVAAELKEQQ